MSRLKKFAGLWVALVVFGLVVPGVFYLVVSWLDDISGLSPLLPEPSNMFAAVIALAIGLFWVLWSYSYLHFVGKGSPVEAFGIALYPTQTLVTTGPYSYTRNPMVLGLLFVLLAIVFVANSIAGLILIPILALLAVAYLKAFEERGLVRRFGEDYVEYRKAVPVLVPTFRPYAGSPKG